jgi:acetyl esterase
MSLHPQCKALLDLMAAQPGKPFREMSLAELQAFRAAVPNGLGLAGPPEPVATVEDRQIPTRNGGVSVRIYRPLEEPSLPVLLYFHGGGFALGNLNWVDEPCRALANASGCVVVSVEYRLAPEHPYPAAAEDCYAVAKHIAEHAVDFGVNGDRIAVCGDSAGGNLAAVVAQMARDRRGLAIAFQILIYPCVDYLDQSPSMREFAAGYFLDAADMDWLWRQYAAPEHAEEPYLSPVYGKLAGLPQALVITAECDPLRDQGELYAQKLRAARVPSWVKRYDGTIHGFFHMGAAIDAGKEAILYAGAAAAHVLGSPKAAH